MQFRAVVCSVLCVGANAVSAQAEVSARVWMLDHPESNQDELSDLKTENPDAYALVKALLTKRSLGLLDPKHPTASFAAPAPKEEEGDHPIGAAVYEKFATTQKEQEALQGETSNSVNVPYPDSPAVQAAVPYPEATGANHDWLNWKPKDGATDDEAMVKNVLGAVADLTKGKSLRGAPPAEEASPLEAEAASEEAAESTTVAAPQVEATEVTTTVQTQTAQENSYLKGLDLVPPAPVEKVAPEPQAGGNTLTAFSWDDSQPSTTTTMVAPKGSKGGSNPLASWLGLVKPHVQTAAPTAAKASNPYLMDLS